MGEEKGRGKCNFSLFGWSEKVEEGKWVDGVSTRAHHLFSFHIWEKMGEKMVMRRKVQNCTTFSSFYF